MYHPPLGDIARDEGFPDPLPLIDPIWRVRRHVLGDHNARWRLDDGVTSAMPWEGRGHRDRTNTDIQYVMREKEKEKEKEM